MNLGGFKTLHMSRVSEMTKKVIRTTYPNFVLMSSVYGVNERVGVEGLQLMGEQQRYTSTPVIEPSINLDVLVEVHVECSIERFGDHRDMGIMPEWNPRGDARTADEDHP